MLSSPAWIAGILAVAQASSELVVSGLCPKYWVRLTPVLPSKAGFPGYRESTEGTRRRVIEDSSDLITRMDGLAHEQDGQYVSIN
jgi:hypothetical protein